jgi:hypothetical protein
MWGLMARGSAVRPIFAVFHQHGACLGWGSSVVVVLHGCGCCCRCCNAGRHLRVLNTHHSEVRSCVPHNNRLLAFGTSSRAFHQLNRHDVCVACTCIVSAIVHGRVDKAVDKWTAHSVLALVTSD